jgi:hypothetical protein
MKVLFDTCIVFDVLAWREPFANASKASLDLAAEKRCEGFLSAKSVTDIFYLTNRLLHDTAISKKTINDLLTFLGLLDTEGFDIRQALSSPMLDFEDAVLSFDAAYNHVDYIVTRNTKDFVSSPVPALTPSEFIALLSKK